MEQIAIAVLLGTLWALIYIWGITSPVQCAQRNYGTRSIIFGLLATVVTSTLVVIGLVTKLI